MRTETHALTPVGQVNTEGLGSLNRKQKRVDGPRGISEWRWEQREPEEEQKVTEKTKVKKPGTHHPSCFNGRRKECSHWAHFNSAGSSFEGGRWGPVDLVQCRQPGKPLVLLQLVIFLATTMCPLASPQWTGCSTVMEKNKI